MLHRVKKLPNTNNDNLNFNTRLVACTAVGKKSIQERKQFKMKTPFTIEQFFSAFEKYNTALFPFQLIIILMGIFALLLIHINYSLKIRLIGSFLGMI